MDHIDPVASLPERPPPPRSPADRVRDWVAWFGIARLVSAALVLVALLSAGFWLLRAPQPGVELPPQIGWPLQTGPIRDTCQLLQMPATVNRALRVLAHHDAPTPTERVAWARPAPADRRTDAGLWSDGGRMRFPPLKKRQPVDQLALFSV